MPRRARLAEPAPAGTVLVEDQPDERAIEAYEVLSEILANVGETEAVLRINRRTKTGNLEFCEQIPATPDFSEETIRRSWGGGTYSVQLYGPNPDKPGSRKYIRQVSMQIAGPSKVKPEEPEPGANVMRAGYDPEVQTLRLQLATMQGMLAGMQSAKSVESTNPLDNLEKLTTVMKNLMPPANQGSDAKEAFALAREVIGFGKELSSDGDGGGGGSPWGALIEKGISPMIDLIKQNMDAQKTLAAGNVGVETPVPVVTAGASAPVLVPEAGTPMWQAEIVKVMPRLIARAKAGKSPELIAGLFVEDAPGAVVQELAALVSDPQFVPTALTLAERYFPDVVPVRAWFEEFLLAVKEELTEQPETKAEPDAVE